MRGEEVLKAACAAWAANDLVRLMDLIDPAIVFAVNVPACVDSYMGNGYGKELFRERLQLLRDRYEVTEFEPSQVKSRGVLWHSTRVNYCYRDRRTRLECEGTMRNHCRIVDGRLVHLELLVDAAKMDAFRKLTEAAGD